MKSSTITVTDMFCGAGGSSTGAVQAGADVQLALNHWPRALETHHTNHPNTTHVLTDISRADPWRYPSTTILIASPECTNHSLSKGKPRKGVGWAPLPGFGEAGYDPAEERSRCTMFDPLRWAECHGYETVILENVVDARYWVMWDAWLLAWQNLGYDHEIVYLNSMFAHPTPQSRDRMYVVAWKRGNRKPDLAIRPLAYCPTCGCDVEAVQSWKHPTRRAGKYRQQYVYRCREHACEVTPYFYPASAAIEWSRPIQRIGDRAKPLKEKTLARIAYGLEKFAGHPFSIPMTRVQDRLRDLREEPFPTQTATETQGLVLTLSHDGGHENRVYPAESRPLPTQTIRDDIALVTPPFLIDHIAEYRPRPITGPMSTIVASGNHQSLVLPPAWLLSYYNHGTFEPVSEPVSTVTTLERHALVTAPCEKPRVEDCGFRMLEPSEIQAAMAFPRDYVVTGTRREKVKQLGNAVTPPVMQLLVSRCMAALA
jgi:DNA (cytosine-5)-methyltransferase 1